MSVVGRYHPSFGRNYATAMARERAKERAIHEAPVFQPSAADHARAVNLCDGRMLAASELLREWQALGLLDGQP